MSSSEAADRVLIDTATFEYAFCEVFWRGERDVFESVFAAPLAAYNTFVAQGALQVATTTPSVYSAAIRVNNAHRRVMSRRRVPALDAYIDNVNMTLWPNFKSACDLHIKSLDDMQQLLNRIQSRQTLSLKGTPISSARSPEWHTRVSPSRATRPRW